MSVGSVFVEIIPRVMGMSAAMTRDVVAPAEQGGTEAGRTFSTAFTRSVTSGTSATTTAVQSQVRAAQAAVEQSSVAISAARDKELAAADRVTIAETKLAETRARNAAGSSQVVAAEARLEAAKRGEVTASERLVLAESNEGRAKTELIARNDALATSNARAGESSAAGSSKALGLVGSLSKLAIGTTAVSAILGGDALHQAGNYQQSLTKLATTAGESTGNLKLVGDGLLNMAGEVGVSAQDLAKGMYTVESAGFHGADGLLVMKAAAEGSVQEQADLGHVTDAVTTALHDYNLPATDAAKVTSQLVTAVSHGKTTFDELTGAMHSVTPVAAAAGISLADAAGTLASMTASGMSADQAAQNLGSTIKGLSAPTQPVIKEMAALGLNSVELSKNLGKTGVAGTLQEVSEAILSKMGPAGTTLLSTLNQSKLAGNDATKMYQAMAPEVRKVADQLVNGTITSRQFTTGTGHLDAAMQGQAKSWLTQYKNATGFSAALKSGGNDTQTYMEALKRATGTTDGMAVALQVTGEHAGAANAAIKDIAGATAQSDGNIKGWDEVLKNFNLQVAKVVDSIRSWVIELGQKLLPAATELLKFLMDAGHWLGEHSRLIGEVAKWVGIAVGAFVAWRAAMIAGQAITVAWGVVMGVFNGTITATTIATRLAAAGQWLWNVALDANPVGIVIVAIGALVAGVIYAYTHFEGFRNVVNDVWEAMKLAFRWVETAGVNTWHALVAAFNWTKDAFNSVKDAGVSLWHELQAAWDSLLDATKTVVAAIVGSWHSFTDTLSGYWTVLKNATTITVSQLVNTWHSFTSAISTAWNEVIKPTFEWIGNAFEMVGRIIFAVVGTVILAQFRVFMATVHALWNDAVHPVLNLIGDLFHWLHDAVIKPVIGFIKDAINAWGAAVHWLYDSVVKPVMDAIGAAWHWVYDTSVKIVTDLINDAIRGWATTVTWLHDNVIKPVFDAIAGAFHYLYDTSVKVVTDLINDAIRGWATTTTWIHDNVIVPVFNAISDTFHWLHDTSIRVVVDLINAALAGWGEATHFLHEQVIKPVFDGISTSFHWLHDNVVLPVIDLIKAVIADLENALHVLYDNVVKPVFDAIGSIIRGSYDNVIKPAFEALKTGVHDVGSTFDTVVTAIGVIWDKMKALVATPINFVIDTVLNNGLFKAWDDVAGLVGLPKAPHMDPVKFADGGVMPGYTPGQDVHQFVSPTGGRLELSGGEAIMRPEWTRAMGGPGAVAEMNRAARSGTLSAFVDGGIASFADGGVTWPAMFDIVRKQFPWAVDTSDYRPGDPGMHGKGQALDVGAPGDNAGQLAEVAAWIGSNYSNSTQLIHNPNGSIAGGKAVPPSYWGEPVWSQHANHVHWGNDRDPHLNSGNLLGTIGSNISSAAGAVTHFLRDQVGNLFDLAMKPVSAAIGSFGSPPPAIKGLPKGMFDKTESKIRDFITGKADAKDAASSGGGSASLGPLGGNADAYAHEIFRSATEHGFGKDGAVIGLATALVESNLRMYANAGVPESLAFPHDAVGSDHDSVGLFQQRQAGWGTLAERMNAHGSADLFFNKLGSFDWRSMAPGAAAQRVQVSAFPEAYNGRIGDARAMVAGFDDGGWMKPGEGGHNYSTKPEPVFSSSQWEVLRANLNTGQGGGTKIVAGTHVEAGATIVVGDTEKHDREQRQAVNLLVAQARL